VTLQALPPPTAFLRGKTVAISPRRIIGRWGQDFSIRGYGRRQRPPEVTLRTTERDEPAQGISQEAVISDSTERRGRVSLTAPPHIRILSQVYTAGQTGADWIRAAGGDQPVADRGRNERPG